MACGRGNLWLPQSGDVVRAKAAIALATCLGVWLTLGTSAVAQQPGVFGDIRVRGPGVIEISSFWLHLLGAQSPEISAATQYRVEGNTEDLCNKDGIEYQCGLIAMSKLIELSAGKYYYCEFHDFEGDSRRWARCFEGDPLVRRAYEDVDSLNSQWVRSGWAVANTLHTDELVADEEIARAAGTGLWAGPPDSQSAGLPDSQWAGEAEFEDEVLESVTGVAEVVDGATLKIDGTLVRLLYIDAPEIRQNCGLNFGSYACGMMSRSHLIRLTMGKIIYCNLERRPSDDRNWGVCGEDVDGGLVEGASTLNEQMIMDGWAVVDRTISRDYVPLELEADAANVGMWANGVFPKPANWRRGQR